MNQGGGPNSSRSPPRTIFEFPANFPERGLNQRFLAWPFRSVRSSVPVEEQVLVIFAVTSGQMDDVEPANIDTFESELREFARARYGSVLSGIADTGDLPEEELTGLIDAFKYGQERIRAEESERQREARKPDAPLQWMIPLKYPQGDFRLKTSLVIKDKCNPGISTVWYFSI